MPKTRPTKHRLNVSLVVTLSVVVAALTAGGIYVAWRRLPKDPQPYIQAAEAAEIKGDWQRAIENYAKAFAYDRKPEQREHWGIRTGDLLWLNGRENEAAGYYATVIKALPDSVKAQERLVQLGLYQATLMGREEAWLRLIEQADRLIQMDPERGIGHLAAGLGRLRIGRPEYARKALERFETLREVEPDNPTGYFYAATILAATSARPDPSGPRSDPAEADKLMEHMPEGAPGPLLSRFRLYQAIYWGSRPPEGLEALSVEARQERLKAYMQQLRDRLELVTDGSEMTRAEQSHWADLANRWGKPSVAEGIYQAWRNDLVTILSELTNPPVRKAALDNVLRQAPESLTACVRLAEMNLALAEQERHAAGDDPQREKAVRARLEQAGAHVARGLALPGVKAGQFGEIEKAQQCELGMVRARQLMLLADLSRQWSDWDKARSHLEELGRQHPRLTERLPAYYHAAGKVAYQLGMLSVAQRRLEQALELTEKTARAQATPEQADTLMLLAEVYRGLEQYGRAREVLDGRLLSNPAYQDNAYVLLASARIGVYLRDFGRANAILDAILAVPQLKDSPLLDDVKRLKAEVLGRTGQAAQSVALLESIPGVAGTPAQLYREGRLALLDKHYDKALDKFGQVLEKDKAAWPAAMGQCVAHLINNNKEKATEAIRQFVKDNPDHTLAKVQLKALEEGQEPAKALLQELSEKRETPLQRELRLAQEAASAGNKTTLGRHLNEAEKLVGPDTLGRFLTDAFSLSLQVGDLEAARRYHRQLVQRDEDGIGGVSYRAVLLQAEGRIDEAIRDMREVLKLRRADSVTRYRLARLLLASGRGAAAEVIDLYGRSLEDNPLDAETWRGLVRILDQLGRADEAFLAAERGLQVLGSDPMLEEYRLAGWGREDASRNKAIAERERRAKERPADWRNLLNLAGLYYLAGQSAKGEAQARQVLQLAGKMTDGNERLLTTSAVADLFRRYHEPDAGHAVMAAYLKDHPDEPLAELAMAEFLKFASRFEESEKHYRSALKSLSMPAAYLSLADLYRIWRKGNEAVATVRTAQEKAGPAPVAEIQERLATYLIEQGRLDEAWQTIEQFRKTWPDDIRGELLAGHCHIRRGHWKEALDAFDEVIAKRPETALAYYRKAQVVYQANPAENLKVAITNMERALALDPNLLDGQPWMELARLHLQRSDPNEAVTAYRRQLERNPTDLATRVALLDTLSLLTREKEIDIELARAFQLFPDSPHFHIEAGQVAMRRKQPDVAEKHYRQARQMVPKAELPVLGLSIALAAQRKWQAIVDESETWLKDVGKAPRVHLEKARALKELGLQDQMLAELAKAVEAASGLPVQPALLLQLAITLRNSIGFEPAEKWINAYVAAHPDELPAQLMRGHFWALSDKVDQAVASLGELARVHTTGEKGADVRYNLAILLQEHARFPEAAEQFKQVLELVGPRANPIVLNNYAFLLADNLGRPEEAIPLAERAVEATNRSEADLLDTLGWCYIRAGQVKRGLNILDEAKQRKELQAVYYHLAYGYKELGQTEDARQMATKAASMPAVDPRHSYNKQAEELLKSLPPQ